MKSLDGKDLMRGDCVLTKVGDVVIAGNVHELYERIGAVRIAGYPIPVKAADVVLASDAWAGYTEPLIAKCKADAEAKAIADKAAADAEAAKQENQGPAVQQQNTP